MGKCIVTMTVEIEIEDYTAQEAREAGLEAGMETDDLDKLGTMPLYDPGDLIETFHSHFNVEAGDQHTALDGIMDGSNIYARPGASKVLHINVVRVP